MAAMTFQIDTGTATDSVDTPIPKSSGVDDTMQISLTDETRADRLRRQVIANIEACETQEMLDEYMSAEDVLLDTFYMDRPDFWETINDAYENCLGFLPSATQSAQADTDPAAPGNCLGLTF